MLRQGRQKIKALVMFSGGLDSSLACCILQQQGIEVEGAHFRGAFHAGRFEEYDLNARHFSERFNIKLTIFQIGDDFIDILKNPRYGYGSNINPCIDCRIYTLKKAREHMLKIGASFIATGEVLGQRPMSQRKDMLRLIEKQTNMEGLLLRPLSAKLLKPTIPEERGWVERERLFDIRGRSRKPQMALAEKFGIEDYPSPAGGCLLTDPQFSVRIKDLVRHGNLSVSDIELLKVGRHFRLSDSTKAIVGRNQEDNKRILELVKENDTVLRLKNMPGPITILKGRPDKKDIEIAGAITARYSKARQHDLVRISGYLAGADGSKNVGVESEKEVHLTLKPVSDDVITKCMI